MLQLPPPAGQAEEQNYLKADRATHTCCEHINSLTPETHSYYQLIIHELLARSSSFMFYFNTKDYVASGGF